MRGKRKAFQLVLTLVAALPTVAQIAPASVPLGPGTAVTESTPHGFMAASTREKSSTTLDGKFLLLAEMASAATVLDVVTTSRCTSYGACQEVNPLFGSHPSPGRLYGISFSLLAGQLCASAWLRREMPRTRLWMIPPLIATAGHGLAAALNVRVMQQLNTGR
jgi:hypothetical protein